MFLFKIMHSHHGMRNECVRIVAASEDVAKDWFAMHWPSFEIVDIEKLDKIDFIEPHDWRDF